MDIGFDHFGEIEIDHHAKTGYVDPARRDICGDKNTQRPLLEAAKHFLPDELAHVTVKRVGVDTVFGQPSCQFIGPQPRPHEDKRLFIPHTRKLAKQDVTLVGVANEDRALIDGIHRLAGLRGADGDRVGEECLGKRLHFLRHGGREKHRLRFGRQSLENAFNRRQEAEINHLVALVEYEMLYLPEINLALRLQILEPPRRGDDDINTLFQGTKLKIITLTSTDGEITNLQAC